MDAAMEVVRFGCTFVALFDVDDQRVVPPLMSRVLNQRFEAPLVDAEAVEAFVAQMTGQVVEAPRGHYWAKHVLLAFRPSVSIVDGLRALKALTDDSTPKADDEPENEKVDDDSLEVLTDKGKVAEKPERQEQKDTDAAPVVLLRDLHGYGPAKEWASDWPSTWGSTGRASSTGPTSTWGCCCRGRQAAGSLLCAGGRCRVRRPADRGELRRHREQDRKRQPRREGGQGHLHRRAEEGAVHRVHRRNRCDRRARRDGPQ